MKFKFDNIDIDLKFRKTDTNSTSYQAGSKPEIRMNKTAKSVSR